MIGLAASFTEKHFTDAPLELPLPSFIRETFSCPRQALLMGCVLSSPADAPVLHLQPLLDFCLFLYLLWLCLFSSYTNTHLNKMSWDKSCPPMFLSTWNLRMQPIENRV